ncbi:MAG: NAD-dependent epimerase/dehydratase family protein [Bacteriovorax sp.]|nr:NAD-dependent epimerase/dehydratase family protein [Bacteriovorax sp.]
MKSTKVLITGAGGFLGSYIARELIKKNYQVFSFSRSEYSFLGELGVSQRLGDLKNYHDVKNALNGMDAVIHTASMVGMWGRYEDFFATNVTGTENVLRAMKELGIRKLVYTSTPSVVFGRESLCGVDETTPYPEHYLTYYAKTKAIAEKMVLRANQDLDVNGLCAVALRPHLIFGPGDMNLVPRVIEAQKKGRLKIIGDGENLVDVLYVENAAAAHVMALEKLEFNHPIAGHAYFLGQGPIKLWDFTNTILTKAGHPIVTKKMTLKKAYAIGFMIECFLKFFRIYNVHPPMTRFVALQLAKSHYFSHHNLEADLGYGPSISIEEGINRLFASK